MSPKPNPKVDSVEEQATPVTQEQPETARPMVIMTELDAQISERLKSQPSSLTEVVSRVEPRTLQGRMSLPAELEKLSYDCTVGETCQHHLWHFDERDRRWDYSNRGQFIFRWLTKHKRALDEAIDVKGWFIANRQLFPQIQKHNVSANGVVERGSSILGFMPVEKALKIRRAPGEKSREFVNSRITNVAGAGEEPKYMMSGSPRSHQYMPKMTPQREGEPDVPAPGEIQPDRDF